MQLSFWGVVLTKAMTAKKKVTGVENVFCCGVVQAENEKQTLEEQHRKAQATVRWVAIEQSPKYSIDKRF